MKTADQIVRAAVDAAGQAGGIDEVKRIAAHGWPGDVDGEEPDKALLNAIQNEACRLVAEYECEVHS